MIEASRSSVPAALRSGTVDSTAKRNGSSEPDCDVFAKLRQERLDRGSVPETLAWGEVDGHGDLLDVVLR